VVSVWKFHNRNTTQAASEEDYCLLPNADKTRIIALEHFSISRCDVVPAAMTQSNCINSPTGVNTAAV